MVESVHVISTDESTGNLDPITSAKILDMLLLLNEEMGTTLVLATHNMDLARRLPRCLHIRDRLVVEGALPA